MLVQNEIESVGDFSAACGKLGDIKTPLLNVIGTVSVPNPCHEVRLEYQVPQGINPAILLLSLVVTHNGGICPEVITDKNVGFSMAVSTCSQYDEIHIVETGQTIPIIKY